MNRSILSVTLLMAALGVISVSFAQERFIEVEDVPIDLTRTHLVPTEAMEEEIGGYDVQTLLMTSGHLELHEASPAGLIYDLQSLIHFRRWLSTTWLGQSHEAYQGAGNVRKRQFPQGPGLYAAVPHREGLCLAFVVNIGRKMRVDLGKEATLELLAGTHCTDVFEVESEDRLLKEIDAVRLIR